VFLDAEGLAGAREAHNALDLTVYKHYPDAARLLHEVRGLHARRPLGLVVVDYVQKVPAPEGRRYGTREQEVAEVSRLLKELAIRCDVAVLACAQLNRGAVGRRPSLADLRESGALEQLPGVAHGTLLARRGWNSTRVPVFRADSQQGGETTAGCWRRGMWSTTPAARSRQLAAHPLVHDRAETAGFACAFLLDVVPPPHADQVAAQASTYGPVVSDFGVEDLAEMRPRRRPSPATAWHHKPVNQSFPHFAEALASHGPARSAAKAGTRRGRAWDWAVRPTTRSPMPLPSGPSTGCFALTQRATWLRMARRLGGVCQL
jgi:DnaB-like helicase C terminal domain